MNAKLKEVLKLISLPLILLAVILVSFLLWKTFSLPDSEQIKLTFQQFFQTYGLIAIFIAGVLESLLLVSQYFPGGFLIILGVISAGDDISRIVIIISVAVLGFLVGYCVDYLIGKYGLYQLFLKLGFKKSLSKYEKLLERHAFKTILVSNWDSHFASVASTAAGILHLNFKKFLLYSLISSAIWNALWGTVVYSLGSAAVNLVGFRSVVVLLMVWITVLLVSYLISLVKQKRNV